MRDYAWRRQRAMIQTYNVIIAATLNTIRYSNGFTQLLWLVMKLEGPH
jgi:hypothetical protein